MEVGEGDQLIAQVEIGHAVLMQMLSKVPIEIPHHLSVIDNEDRNYDQMLMQHPLFNRNQTWYLGRKRTGTPCRCSGCLHPRIAQSVKCCERFNHKKLSTYSFEYSLIFGPLTSQIHFTML